jgi:serine/threonine protein kinase
MGCNASKSSSVHYELHPMEDNGMGCIAKAIDEASSKAAALQHKMVGKAKVKKEVSDESIDLTTTRSSRQSLELSSSLLDDEHQLNLGEGKFGVVLETKVKKLELQDARGDSEEVESQTDVINPTSSSTRPSLFNQQSHVVVKTLTAGASKQMTALFFREIHALLDLVHPHILRLIGIITHEAPRTRALMIFEAPSHGVLKSYLEASKRRDKIISPHHYVSFAGHICRAMKFLHERNAVHSDLVDYR